MEHRARDHLNGWRRAHRKAFDFLDVCHMDKGTGELPDWPQWCYVPMAGGVSVAHAQGLDIEHAATLTALSAWRMTQGIYRFDATLYGSLIDTPVTGDIPTDALYSLPEWCVYVETPEGIEYAGRHVHGAFAWLEFDANDGRHELRLLLDMDELVPAIVHLGGTVQDGIDAAIAEMDRHTAGLDFGHHDTARAWLDPVGRILSLLLYLCSVSDFQRRGEQATPENPAPKRTKRGIRLFGAPGPTKWDVGVRMGSALRQAYQAEQLTTGGSHAGPRGHIRRGHWHSYRVGPRKTSAGEAIPAHKRDLTIRWLPPIAVNLPDMDDLPATIRPVK